MAYIKGFNAGYQSRSTIDVSSAINLRAYQIDIGRCRYSVKIIVIVIQDDSLIYLVTRFPIEQLMTWLSSLKACSLVITDRLYLLLSRLSFELGNDRARKRENSPSGG